MDTDSVAEAMSVENELPDITGAARVTLCAAVRAVANGTPMRFSEFRAAVRLRFPEQEWSDKGLNSTIQHLAGKRELLKEGQRGEFTYRSNPAPPAQKGIGRPASARDASNETGGTPVSLPETRDASNETGGTPVPLSNETGETPVPLPETPETEFSELLSEKRRLERVALAAANAVLRHDLKIYARVGQHFGQLQKENPSGELEVGCND